MNLIASTSKIREMDEAITDLRKEIEATLAREKNVQSVSLEDYTYNRDTDNPDAPGWKPIPYGWFDGGIELQPGVFLWSAEGLQEELDTIDSELIGKEYDLAEYPLWITTDSPAGPCGADSLKDAFELIFAYQEGI